MATKTVELPTTEQMYTEKFNQKLEDEKSNEVGS